MSEGSHGNGEGAAAGGTVKNGGGRSLTITQLRRELNSYGIPLPPSSSKKEVYLQLYDKHILPRTHGGDFSSDDEINDADGDDDQHQRRSVSPSDSLLAAHSDIIDTVEKMKDSELYAELGRLGQKIGPVVDTTRSMYKKLLKSILVQDLKQRHRGDTTTESESEDELNTSTAHLNGSSVSSASNSGSGSSPPGGSTSSSAANSTSFGNGFSSGESDIDNVATSEDYARVTPTKVTRKTTPRKVSPPKRASTPRTEEQRVPTPGRTAGTTKNLTFEIDSFATTLGGRSSHHQEFESRYRARNTATTSSVRFRPSVTSLAGQDWGTAADYGVGYVSGEPEASKARRGKKAGAGGSDSNCATIVCIVFVCLTLLFLGYYYYVSLGNDISKDAAIDQQIEDTLKLLSKSHEGALD